MKLILIRLSRRTGVSAKTNADYDMCSAVFLTASDRKNKSVTSVFSQSGFSELECAVDASFYPQLQSHWDTNYKGIPLAIDVELTLGTPNRVTGFVR